jgi:beta-N-acetylhexosaminidase
VTAGPDPAEAQAAAAAAAGGFAAPGDAAGPAEVLGRVMMAFEGDRLPEWAVERLRTAPVAGMTVFRHLNVRSPAGFRELAETFQAAGRADPSRPRLVAADQEGGQLQALGDGPTQFAGNMAIGATDDPQLADRIGEAIGLEASAMGVNVVYAPVLDVASAPANAAIGIRSFGDDPARVAALGVAFLRGLERAGVAAAVKHFPGLGDTDADTHHALAIVRASRERLDAVDLLPFRAAIDAGVPMVMSSHVAVPALNDGDLVASTLAPAVMTGLLREQLGFDGVAISDALDMQAIAQGEAQAAAILAALRAGVDLLLCGPDRDAQRRIEAAVLAGAADGRIDPTADAAARRRIDALRRRLGVTGPPPDLGIVGGPAHAALARELAERSLTLVRDDARRLPLALPAGATVLAVMPTPIDLTPADTSSTVAPGLAAALRTRFGRVDEVVTSAAPTDAEIAAVRDRVAQAEAVVVGTIDGAREPSQLALLEAVALAAGDRPVVAVALRTPWDVAWYPAGVAAVCTYSIHSASMVALADALAGAIPFGGRLPVRVDGPDAAPASS